MKINKLGTITAAALIVSALAVNAYAAELPAASDKTGEAPVFYAVTENEDGTPSVRVVDVDLSELDLSEMLEGAPVPEGEVGSVLYTMVENEDGTFTAQSGEDVFTVAYNITENEDGTLSAEPVEDAELANIDLSELEEGEFITISDGTDVVLPDGSVVTYGIFATPEAAAGMEEMSGANASLTWTDAQESAEN